MQPLSKVLPDPGPIMFGDDETLIREPKIATLIAECIAKWSDIESVLGFLLGLLSDADPKSALAMYASVENRAAQLRMLDAAAKLKLSGDHYLVFKGLMIKIIKPLMRERDKLAHWCWGYLPERPGLLLLMQPDEKIAMHLLHYEMQTDVDFEKSKIFVIRDKDAERALGRMADATAHLATFLNTVTKKTNEPMRQLSLEKLYREPLIREFVDRHKASQEKPPAAQPQPSSEEDPSTP